MTDLSDQNLHDRFHYHAPSNEGIARHADLSELFTALARRCRDICPPGRELALTITNLEQAKMWASAAVARNEETR